MSIFRPSLLSLFFRLCKPRATTKRSYPMNWLQLLLHMQYVILLVTYSFYLSHFRPSGHESVSPALWEEWATRFSRSGEGDLVRFKILVCQITFLIENRAGLSGAFIDRMVETKGVRVHNSSLYINFANIASVLARLHRSSEGETPRCVLSRCISTDLWTNFFYSFKSSRAAPLRLWTWLL